MMMPENAGDAASAGIGPADFSPFGFAAAFALLAAATGDLALDLAGEADIAFLDCNGLPFATVLLLHFVVCFTQRNRLRLRCKNDTRTTEQGQSLTADRRHAPAILHREQTENHSPLQS